MAAQTPQQMVKSAVQDLIWVVEHQTKTFLASIEAACLDIEATDEKLKLQLLSNDVKEAVCQIVCQIQKSMCQHMGIDLAADADGLVAVRSADMIHRALDNLHRETVKIKTESDAQPETGSTGRSRSEDAFDTETVPTNDASETDDSVGDFVDDTVDDTVIESSVDDDYVPNSSDKPKSKGRKRPSLKVKLTKRSHPVDGDDIVIKNESYSPTTPKTNTFSFTLKKTKLKTSKSRGRPPKKDKKQTKSDTTKKRRYTKIEHSRFRCKICVKAFSSKAALKAHLGTTKHMEKLQQRKEVDVKTEDDGEPANSELTLQDLNSAMEIDELRAKKKPTIPPVPQDCTLCDERVKSRYLLKQHYQKCHPEDLDKNVCEQCKKPFPTEEALADHTRKHKKKRTCDLCAKTFSSTSRYKDHLGTLSHFRKKQENALRNTVAGEKTEENEDESLLFPHAMRICSICGQTFSSKTSLYNHMHAIHSTSNDYICHICGKSWNCRAKLSAHMDTHLKRYKCDFCGESFSRKRLRDSHRRIHTGEQPFKCPHCPKAFREGYLLRKHVKTHSSARPFSCNSCDAKFKIKGHLQRHQSQVHNSERPHKCIYCAEGFMEKRHLQKHLYQHTGESEFRCTFCGKFLANKNSLNTHLMQYHNKPLPVLTSAEHLLPNQTAPGPTADAVIPEPQPDFTGNASSRENEEQEVIERFQSDMERRGLLPTNQFDGRANQPDTAGASLFRHSENPEPTHSLFGAPERAMFHPQAETERSLFQHNADPHPQSEAERPIFPPLRGSTGQSLFSPPQNDLDRVMLPQNEVERAMLQYAYERHMLQ